MRIFCRLVRVDLQQSFAQFSNPAQFRVLAQEFGALHKILHITKAINGAHIPVFVHVIRG
jgi:hypothetical protein